MFKVICINKENFHLFRKFFVNDSFLQSDYLAFGTIINNNTPCAMICAVLKKNSCGNVWCIENFYVLTKYRNLGIGSALLQKLRSKLIFQEYKKLYLKLVTSSSGLPLLNQFLTKRGFSEAIIETRIYRKTVREICNNNKFIEHVQSQKKYELPRNLKIIKQGEIIAEIRNNTLKESGISYPENLSPFINENNLKDVASLYVLNTANNTLVAWLTAFDAFGKCVLYRSFFVKKKYRLTGIGRILLNTVVKNHLDNLFSRDVLFAVSKNNVKVEKSYTKYFNLNKENASYEILMNENKTESLKE